jgi:hypothetical protein
MPSVCSLRRSGLFGDWRIIGAFSGGDKGKMNYRGMKVVIKREGASGVLTDWNIAIDVVGGGEPTYNYDRSR